MFAFANPYAFLLLLPAGTAAWFVYRRARKKAVAFSRARSAASLGVSLRARVSAVLPALFIAGLALSVIALARPRKTLSVVRRNVDAIGIEMVVDVSGSMEALDMSVKRAGRIEPKTRLEAVKETFAEFIKNRPDDLIGLVTFGGYASTRAPLTPDHDLLLHILKGVDVPKGGDQEETLTAIGDALATACARLKDARLKSRIVVLLSDGVSNTGIIRPESAARAAKELGLRVYTIGIGTTGRAPFRARDIFGRETVMYGNVEFDEAMLQKLAEDTGGKYFNVRDPDGLRDALGEIDKLEKTEIDRDIFRNYSEFFPWFLVPGMVLLAFSTTANMLVARRIV